MTYNYNLFRITLLLSAIGAVNWGLVALFNFDLVAYLFGSRTKLTDAVYIVVALSGISSLALHFLTPPDKIEI